MLMSAYTYGEGDPARPLNSTIGHIQKPDTKGPTLQGTLICANHGLCYLPWHVSYHWVR